MGYMNPGDDQFVVTMEGECVRCEFKRKFAPANRDATLYFFHVYDAVSGRGRLLLNVPISEGAVGSTSDVETRSAVICLNAIRRAFDQGVVGFGKQQGASEEYFEIPQGLVGEAFPRIPLPDDKVRQFIIHAAYWLAYKNSPNPGSIVYDFGSELELDYLGVDKQVVVRHVWRLSEEGLLSKERFPTTGRPTAKLIQVYESQEATPPQGPIGFV